MSRLEEIRTFITEQFPQSSVEIEKLWPGGARVRQDIAFEHLRPGGTVSGPSLVFVADVACYTAILNEIGIVPMVYSTNISISFMRLPRGDRPVFAEAELLKAGRRLVFADVRLFGGDSRAVIAQFTGTYSVPPRSA